MNILIRFLWILVILQLKKCLVWSCSPGPRYGYRHNSYFNKLTPMVLGQYLPAVSETTLGASGSRRIAITRGSGAFAKLLRNLNTDIEFSDEEADGSDRYMTQVMLRRNLIVCFNHQNEDGTTLSSHVRITPSYSP